MLSLEYDAAVGRGEGITQQTVLVKDTYKILG